MTFRSSEWQSVYSCIVLRRFANSAGEVPEVSPRIDPIRPHFHVLAIALALLFAGTAFLDYTASVFHPVLIAGFSTIFLAFVLIAAVMNVR